MILSFYPAHVRVLVSMECVSNRDDCFHMNKLKYTCAVKKDYAEKISKTTSIKTHSQHWVGNR